MNLRAWALLAVVAAFPFSGCVVRNYAPGDITFTWSFNGQGCAMVPQVNSVRITIPGQPLQNDGVYPCTNSRGGDSIELVNFRAGTYSYTVRGWSAQGEELYAVSGSITVNGDVANDVSLRSVTCQSSSGCVTNVCTTAR